MRLAYRLALAFFGFFCISESYSRIYHLSVRRPSEPLDEPFATQCQEPDIDGPRENAVIVMLARNSDMVGAASAIESLERNFNRWFHYPMVFINDQPWDEDFITRLLELASGNASFVQAGNGWGYPDWVDQGSVLDSLPLQKEHGSFHAELESYHHMCRFQSGPIFDHEALRPYKWYWRVEPDVQYTCAITYDPFVGMAKANKVYGYTIALWEIGKTVEGLFPFTSKFKDANDLPTTNLWRSMVDPAWAPLFLRPLLSSLFPNRRDHHGDLWNLCHFWSNFEIADMDFFRSSQYRAYFDALDREGGFYYERWGDAAVHSLAAALFLEPEQLHYFADFGYRHEPFFNCPSNAPDGQLPDSALLGTSHWEQERVGGIGCRCECDPQAFSNRPICLNKLRQGVV